MHLGGFGDTDSVLGKYVVNGTSARVVTVDAEHYEVKNIPCNKSHIARKVIQNPHPCSSSGV